MIQMLILSLLHAATTLPGRHGSRTAVPLALGQLCSTSWWGERSTKRQPAPLTRQVEQPGLSALIFGIFLRHLLPTKVSLSIENTPSATDPARRGLTEETRSLSKFGKALK